MGMFKLLDSFTAYNIYISEFKCRHGLNPFTAASVLKKVGYENPLRHPLQYPCLISSTKAFRAVRNKIVRGDELGDEIVDTVDTTHNIIINEVYYRSQAKKLVYPSKGPLGMPKSIKIYSSYDFDMFIETFWENYYRNNGARGNEHKDGLQIYQVNKLCDDISVEALPYIITLREIDIDNLLTTVVVFFVLTKKEAKSLVYYHKDIDLKREYDEIRGRFVNRADNDIPF